jgi:hypothetical protein
VEDEIHPRDERVKHAIGFGSPDHDLESIGSVMGQIRQVSRGQVINDRHFVPSVEVVVDQVRADEARPAGDEDAHQELSADPAMRTD